MTKRMLIDASHAEETRVVVLDGTRLEEFDLEAATRKPLKGNIYLAKVVRVEPSLQAAFVEYGGNRHGFLAFSEIHPDYYQIPVADRQRLLQMQAEEAREAEEADEDPIPETAMDRAAEEEIAGRARDEGEADSDAEAVTVIDPEAGDAAGAEARDEDPDETAPPPGIESATAAESEAGAVESSDPPLAAESAPPAAAEDAPAGPLGGEADAAAPDQRGGGFDAAPAEALEAPAGSDAEPQTPAVPPDIQAGAADPEPPAAGPDAAQAGDASPADEAIAAGTPAGEEAAAAERPRHRGEARHARRRDGRGRGRRDDRRGEDGRGPRDENRGEEARALRGDEDRDGEEEEAPPETLGGDGPEETEGGREEGRRIPPRFLRHYKIQEVIKRRQIMLVQVVKEERGTKGAALTSYISLAGRFSVLMPNSPRGGGVSRKITSATDRKRLREAIDELGLPDGMSLIVRTAGAQRPKPEIKRDCEYLLRLWDNIRERTLASTAPALIYEEADLIKRSIRDVFSRDVEEIIVEGEDAYQEARDFMRMLMPQHVKKVQYAREGGLFARAQVEQQLDAMHSPTVQLKSGGYIVINQTEALVAIDVNSGRATRERHIEDTALRTNLEAADEIARQLRLRDLAGLIVIDFIDMESSKHDGMVERRLKEALRFDRARIQVGRISHFGLLEMSRQRLRPSLAETSFVTCPHCQGRGTVRSIESSALSVLRAIEEEGAKRRAAEIAVHCCSAVALYLLNRKRDRLTQLEEHFGMAVLFEPDESLTGPGHRIERLRAAEPTHARALPQAPQAALRMDYAPEPEPEEEEEDRAEDEAEEAGTEAAEGATQAPAAATAEGAAEAQGDGEGGRRRRRRRRRRSGPRTEGAPGSEAMGDGEEGGEDSEEESAEEETLEAELAAEGPGSDEGEAEGAPRADAPAAAEARGPRRRRGRRGTGPRPEGAPSAGEVQARPAAPPMPPPAPRYLGPTPADPFAGHVDDILAAMEAAEAAAEAAAASRMGRMQPAPAAPPPAPAEAPRMIPEAEAAPDAAPAADAQAPDAQAPDAPVPDAPVPESPALAGQEIPADAPVTTPAPAAETPAVSEAAAAPAPDTPAAPDAPVPGLASEGMAAEAAPPVPNGASDPAAAPAPLQGAPVLPKVLGEAPIEAPRRAGWWRR